MKKETKKEIKFLSTVFGIPILCVAFIIGMASIEWEEEKVEVKTSRYDGEYWRSVNREQQFKDAGLDEFAKIERRKRLRDRY